MNKKNYFILILFFIALIAHSEENFEDNLVLQLPQIGKEEYKSYQVDLTLTDSEYIYFIVPNVIPEKVIKQNFDIYINGKLHFFYPCERVSKEFPNPIIIERITTQGINSQSFGSTSSLPSIFNFNYTFYTVTNSSLKQVKLNKEEKYNIVITISNKIGPADQETARLSLGNEINPSDDYWHNGDSYKIKTDNDSFIFFNNLFVFSAPVISLNNSEKKAEVKKIFDIKEKEWKCNVYNIIIFNDKSYDEVYIVVPKGFGAIIKNNFIFYVNNEIANIKLCYGDEIPSLRYRGSRVNDVLNADIFTFINAKGRQKEIKYKSKIKIAYSRDIQSLKYSYGNEIGNTQLSFGDDTFTIRLFEIIYKTEEERDKEEKIKAKEKAENELMDILSNN